jgi:HEAT repeat protein
MKSSLTTVAMACLLIPSLLFSQPASPAPVHVRQLVEQLRSSDPGVRGAAKLELMSTHPPEALPLLAQALDSASGAFQQEVLEILSAFKDLRKIPILLKLGWQYYNIDGPPKQMLDQQLVELGAPAAKALMHSVPDNCESIYADWVAGLLGSMRPSALPVLLAGIRSASSCKQQAAGEGLTRYFCCEDQEPGQFENPTTRLFLAAALNDNKEISSPAQSWIASLQPNDVANFEPVQVVEVLIRVYRGKVSAATRVGIATMLAEMPNDRITRFMRAATHAPSREIQKIARAYLADNAPASTSTTPPETTVPLNTSKQKIAAANEWSDSWDATANTPLLVKLLDDPDPDVRAAAANNLAALNTRSDMRNTAVPDLDDSVPPLLKALKDPSSKVRLEVVKALGLIEYNRENSEEAAFPDLVIELEKLLHDPEPGIVVAAVEALGGIRSPGSAKAVALLAENPNDEIRVAAMKALVEIDSAESTCLLLARTDDPNQIIRQSALDGISQGFSHGERCPEDVEKLLTILRNPVRSLSALGPLGRIRDPRSIEPLIAALNVNTVCSVGDTLASVGGKRAVQPLLAYLPDNCALHALTRLNDAASVPAIAALLSNPKDFVRRQAINSLTDMKQCQLMTEIRKGLSDDSAEVRSASARAAEQCLDRDSLDLLVRMLPIDVRVAAHALGTLDDARAVDPLIAALGQAKPYEASAVADALGKLRDPKAVEPLAAVIRLGEANHEFQLSNAAVAALGEIANAAAISVLQEVVKRAPAHGGYSPLADNATEVLKRLGAPIPARSARP